MSKNIGPTTEDIPTFQWALQAPDCRRDLLIKKFAVLLIAMINVAALGTAFYFIITYCPMPTQSLRVSPFIVGILGALAYMKFPIIGVTPANYTNVNPMSIIGRGLAYLFFGSLIYAINKIDWTPYHDPFRANRISQDLSQEKFQQIADTYGKHFDNIVKYGFIHESQLQELQSINDAYQSLKKSLNFYQKEYRKGHEKIIEIENEIEQLNEKWQKLKSHFIYSLPYPPTPSFDFDKKTTAIKLKAREYCCTGNPCSTPRL